jgi:ubiquinone/menaquinone biosynthesis C-methylase UbiE
MTTPITEDRWTDPDGQVAYEWIEQRERMDHMLEPFGTRMLDQAGLKPGDGVLDIGCGTGTTAIAAWQRVAPTGHVTGVDISPSMLVVARERAAAMPNAALTWVHADAQTYPFPSEAADAAISRFGVAHFSDTIAALANIARGLRPGGRIAFAEWRARAENEWMTFAGEVAQRVLPELFTHRGNAPEHAGDFAGEQQLRAVLTAAGLEVQVLERFMADMWMGSSPDDVIAWFARLPEGQFLQKLRDADRQRFLKTLHAELERRTRPDGVYLVGAAWVVEARRQSSG